MPYELSFTKLMELGDRDQYINECCIGGDVVSGALLTSIRSRYSAIHSGQEDWGWYIWFRKGDVRLAVDIFTDDPEVGSFRIHLTSRVAHLLFFTRTVDTKELDELRAVVMSDLTAWVGSPVQVARLDSRYFR